MLTISLIGRRVGGQFPKSYTDPIINSNNAICTFISSTNFRIPSQKITQKALWLFNKMQITDPRLYNMHENNCIRNLTIKSLNLVSTLTASNSVTECRQARMFRMLQVKIKLRLILNFYCLLVLIIHQGQETKQIENRPTCRLQKKLT